MRQRPSVVNKVLEFLLTLASSLKSKRSVAFSMIISGLAIFVGLSSFHLFGFYSSIQLETLNVEFDGPIQIPENDIPFKIEPVQAATLNIKDQLQNTESNQEQLPKTKLDPKITEIVIPHSEIPLETSTKEFLELYNSENFRIPHPKYWGNPLSAGSDPYLPKKNFRPLGFLPLDDEKWKSVNVFSLPMQMSIPLVKIESSISELRIIDHGNHLAYETPNNVIGHIPKSANPAEIGNGWYFGHIESPIAKEGSVFHKLPKVATLLRDGEPVYITISSTETEFLYQVVSSLIIHKDELELYETKDHSITLVTCSNRPYYDHRQLVTGKLIGFKQVSPPN